MSNFFLKSQKNMFFKNISKTTQYFFLIYSAPKNEFRKHRLECCKLTNRKFFQNKNLELFSEKSKKHAYREYLRN